MAKYYIYKENGRKRKMDDLEVIQLAVDFLRGNFNLYNFEQIYPNSKIKHATAANYLRSRLKSIDVHLYERVEAKCSKGI